MGFKAPWTPTSAWCLRNRAARPCHPPSLQPAGSCPPANPLKCSRNERALRECEHQLQWQRPLPRWQTAVQHPATGCQTLSSAKSVSEPAHIVSNHFGDDLLNQHAVKQRLEATNSCLCLVRPTDRTHAVLEWGHCCYWCMEAQAMMIQTHTHTHTHARARARTHTRTHKPSQTKIHKLTQNTDAYIPWAKLSSHSPLC